MTEHSPATPLCTREASSRRCSLVEDLGNPQPQTLNPEPSTLNPKPRTLNPEPETRNPNPFVRLCTGGAEFAEAPGAWQCRGLNNENRAFGALGVKGLGFRV